MPKQEKIKSVILTGQSEFRVSMVQTLNTLGFHAEKVNAENLAELGKLLAVDQLVWNVVIDAASYFPDDAKFENCLAEIAQAVGTSAVSVLIYLAAEKHDALAETLGKFPKFQVRSLPVRRQDLVEAFIKPFMARHGHGKVEKPVAKSPSPAGEAIGEAIEHVRQTVELLKQVATDANAVEQFAQIGQRFNGLYGAYLFLDGKDGYHQLRMLCVHIPG